MKGSNCTRECGGVCSMSAIDFVKGSRSVHGLPQNTPRGLVSQNEKKNVIHLYIIIILRFSSLLFFKVGFIIDALLIAV